MGSIYTLSYLFGNTDICLYGAPDVCYHKHINLSTSHTRLYFVSPQKANQPGVVRGNPNGIWCTPNRVNQPETLNKLKHACFYFGT